VDQALQQSLRQKLKANGRRYEEIAHKAGLHQFTVARFACGVIPLAYKSAAKLAAALGCRIEMKLVQKS
jgi:hypothetical protein